MVKATSRNTKRCSVCRQEVHASDVVNVSGSRYVCMDCADEVLSQPIDSKRVFNDAIIAILAEGGRL